MILDYKPSVYPDFSCFENCQTPETFTKKRKPDAQLRQTTKKVKSSTISPLVNEAINEILNIKEESAKIRKNKYLFNALSGDASAEKISQILFNNNISPRIETVGNNPRACINSITLSNEAKIKCTPLLQEHNLIFNRHDSENLRNAAFHEDSPAKQIKKSYIESILILLIDTQFAFK